jgi:hypothetical protein
VASVYSDVPAALMTVSVTKLSFCVNLLNLRFTYRLCLSKPRDAGANWFPPIQIQKTQIVAVDGL